MPRCYVSDDVTRRLAFHERAIRSGTNSSTIDNSFKCQRPVTIELVGLPSKTLEEFRRYGDFSMNAKNNGLPVIIPDKRDFKYYVDMDVPCRKCEACLKRRGAIWSARAYRETKHAPRTWFCTYTINPDWRFRVHLEAKRKYGREDYAALYAVISGYFTKYLKRVRKESGTKLRFLLAAEAHKDGFPHLHALIHEVDAPIRKALLQRQWPYGFTVIKLCDAKSANYVTKYIAKQNLARVRASLRYGFYDDLDHSPEGVFLDLPPFLVR